MFASSVSQFDMSYPLLSNITSSDASFSRRSSTVSCSFKAATIEVNFIASVFSKKNIPRNGNKSINKLKGGNKSINKLKGCFNSKVFLYE